MPGSARGNGRDWGPDPGWRAALCALAWLLGLAWQMQLAWLWSPATHVALAALGGLAGIAAWLLAGRVSGCSSRWTAWWQLGLAMLAAAALAAAMAGMRAQWRLAERLAPELEGLDLIVTGVVAGLPQRGASGLRFQFEVERARWSAHDDSGRPPPRLPPVLALGWYQNYADEVALADPGVELRAGQRWRLPLRLKRPHGTLNPGGFDVELLWFEQGLGATGYVRVLRGNRTGPGEVGAEMLAEAVAHPVERLREAVRSAIWRQVADPRSAGVLAALAVGDQAAIEREDWDLFRRTGIAHLVSISGVHITMFAWAAAALAGRLWRRSTHLMLWLPAPTAGRWVGLALATSYAMLAGWGVPAQRTLIMLGVTGLLRSQGQRWPWLLVLLAAAVTVTLLDPWALLQAGFWLSFAAVGLLLLSEPVSGRAVAVQLPVQGAWLKRLRAKTTGHLRDHLRGQVVATLGLAPLSLVFFQQLSVVGFAANLVAIPLVTLLITPLALFGVLLPGAWQLAAALVQALVWGLSWLASFPWAVYSAASAPAWALACGLVGALLAVLQVPLALRWLALPLALPLLWPVVARPPQGQFELLAADIGQGNALLVRTRSHLLVYDAGPQYTVDVDAGQRVLLPMLRARGERRIDLLVLSHRDIDHVGGAASLLAGIPISALSSSLETGHSLLNQAAQLGVAQQRCDAGQHWSWDGVRFEVLHPTPAEHRTATKPNALSCVLRVIDAQGRSALLAGDIEAPQEAALVLRQGAALSSTVLLVPHHGSRTSSSSEFIDTVHPGTAVVQSGYRNRYGHPAPDVLVRYSVRGIEVVRSDRCGAWLWRDGVGHCTRDLRRRYWHWTESGVAQAAAGAKVAK